MFSRKVSAFIITNFTEDRYEKLTYRDQESQTFEEISMHGQELLR